MSDRPMPHNPRPYNPMPDNCASWDRPQPFTQTIIVEEQHIDGLNHVNNAVYVSWCQDAAWAHSQALGLSLADYRELDVGVAIRHAEYDYIDAAYRGEELIIGTWLTRCDGRLQMERCFQLLRKQDAGTIMRARWELVSIRPSNGKPRRMPEVFTRIYGGAVIN